jgi:hypothetical protein
MSDVFDPVVGRKFISGLSRLLANGEVEIDVPNYLGAVHFEPGVTIGLSDETGLHVLRAKVVSWDAGRGKLVIGAILTVLALLCACSWEMPPHPLPLQRAAGVDDATWQAFLDAADGWTDATGELVAGPGEGHCAARVVPAGDLDPGEGGRCSLVAPCMIELRLRQDLPDAERVPAAEHELGHALMTCSDADHSADPHSVMWPDSRASARITSRDARAIRTDD